MLIVQMSQNFRKRSVSSLKLILKSIVMRWHVTGQRNPPLYLTYLEFLIKHSNSQERCGKGK